MYRKRDRWRSLQRGKPIRRRAAGSRIPVIVNRIVDKLMESMGILRPKQRHHRFPHRRLRTLPGIPGQRLMKRGDKRLSLLAWQAGCSHILWQYFPDATLHSRHWYRLINLVSGLCCAEVGGDTVRERGRWRQKKDRWRCGF